MPTETTPHVAGAPQYLGRYEILRLLATGGMAELYLARSTGIEGFEKLIVCKRILPQYTSRKDIVEMFLDEARIAAMLHHSNIVQVFDIGEDGGNYFFAMEFLHGEDTSRLMKAVTARREQLPLEHAINIMLGVCAGLHYAHELKRANEPLNLVHRDVSPQNVFVTYDGGIKLLDFGIAKAENKSSATRVGQLKGKIRYMSPEQSRALPLDRRSDIFSAGILLWELTTGRRLYRGASDFDVLKAIIEGDAPAPSMVKPDYPKPLEKIVMRALRRNREERWQTAQEMQLALEEFARERRLQISPVAMANYLKVVCGERIAAWEQALATRSGIVEHIAGTMMSISETPWLESSDEVMALHDAPTVMERTPSAVLPERMNLRPSYRRWWIVGGSAVLALGLAIAIVSRPVLQKPMGIPAALPNPPPRPALVEPKPVVEPAPPKPTPAVAKEPEPERPPPPRAKPAPPKPKPKKVVAKPPTKKRVDLDSPLPP